MTQLEQLLEERGVKVVLHANQKKIPSYALDNTIEGAHEFNIYYQELLQKGWNRIVRTAGAGKTKVKAISIARKNFKPPMWDVSYTNACIELTIITNKMLRIQFRQITSVEEEDGPVIYGYQAMMALKAELKKDKIDLEKYAITNGAAIKPTVPKYIIALESKAYTDLTFENCHHIDFHNSFPAGLVNTHPEFRPTIERLYESRKSKPINKSILNNSIGYFHSLPHCGARWAHLAKDAIQNNNDRLRELAQKLKEAGRLVISYNTDGIWYSGDIYHGEGEGKKLGEWENDHVNCKFRAKSAGAYEFIEDGKYHPVIRGRTNYDLIKPRTEWEWGDIYRKESKPFLFYWKEGEGITNEKNELL